VITGPLARFLLSQFITVACCGHRLHHSVMENTMNTLVTRIAIATGLLGLAHSALAQDCQVLDRFPVEIDRSGNYCLDQTHDVDVTSGYAAILITASDVDLDLRGYTLRNPTFFDEFCDASNINDRGTGIRIVEARNVRIHDGALRCFGIGVAMKYDRCEDCNTGNRVERMRIHESSFAGIFARGDLNVFADNQIIETGGIENRAPTGIHSFGIGNVIRNNDVQLVFDGVGINVGGSSGLVIENRVLNADTGFYLAKSVRYRDNVTTLYSTSPYVGQGDDLGNND